MGAKVAEFELAGLVCRGFGGCCFFVATSHVDESFIVTEGETRVFYLRGRIKATFGWGNRTIASSRHILVQLDVEVLTIFEGV